MHFLQIEFLWQPHIKQVCVGIILTTAFAHFISVCHILVILTVFQTFSVLYLLWQSVIFDIMNGIALECTSHAHLKQQTQGS